MSPSRAWGKIGVPKPELGNEKEKPGLGNEEENQKPKTKN